MNVFDPMVRDYRGRELEPGIATEIVLSDKDDIDAVDALLVLYEKPSVGTSMEVLYAYEREKLIVVVDKSGKPLSPWLLYHSHVQVKTLAEAADFLRSRDINIAYLAGPINGCTDAEANDWRTEAKALLA